jgi:signal transduction histidine kinase
MRAPRLRFPTVRVQPERLDLAVAALLTVGAQLQVWLGNGDVADHHQVGTALASAFTTLSVAVRRRWPLQLGVAVGWVVSLELAAWGDPQIIASSVAYFCALYGLTAWTSRREFLLGIGLLLVPLPVDVLAPHGPGRSSIFFTAVTLTVMLLVRVVLGDRERRIQLAERERDLTAREAIASERARIARELHDVVAHSVSVMVVQAQAGPRLLTDPEQASGVFSSIEATGREALVELRRLLGVLRSGDEHAATAPQPGLGSLDTLLGQVRDTGLHVDLRIEGDRVALPAGVDLSAYRIVQEALTNTLKHAGRAEAEVIVRYDTGFVELEILDNGVGPQAHSNGVGHGIAGMRERVALYGGALETGSRNGHGFAIRARLPLAAEPAA